jgi:hypothetical protein
MRVSAVLPIPFRSAKRRRSAILWIVCPDRDLDLANMSDEIATRSIEGPSSTRQRLDVYAFKGLPLPCRPLAHCVGIQ